MPDMIPTDRTAIQAEIAALLEETPLTTDRGRLMHLLNALESTGGGGGASGSDVYKLATLSFDSSQVSPNGVVVDGAFAFDTLSPFSLTGGNFMTLSLNDASGTLDSNLNQFANLFNLFGTVFTIVITAEGVAPAQFGNVKLLANINGLRPTTFALEFFNSPFESGANFTDGANYDIYIVPVQPYNPAGYFGTPIDSSYYSMDLTDTTPSRFNVYANNSDPTMVTQIIVGQTNGLVRAKLGALANRSLILVTNGQENIYSVSAVDTSNSSQVTLTVSNTEDGVSSFNANDQVYLAVF